MIELGPNNKSRSATSLQISQRRVKTMNQSNNEQQSCSILLILDLFE